MLGFDREMGSPHEDTEKTKEMVSFSSLFSFFYYFRFASHILKSRFMELSKKLQNRK